jgi:hypothetical protein
LLAAAFIGRISYPWLFVANALTFAVVVLASASIRHSSGRSLRWGHWYCTRELPQRCCSHLRSVSSNIWFALAAAGIWGSTTALGIEGATNILVHDAEPASRGGLLALYLALWNALYGVGNVVAGVMCDAIGIRQAHTFAGLLFVPFALFYLASVTRSPAQISGSSRPGISP